MPESIDFINRFSTAWAGLMGAIVWQSALLVAIVTLAALALRRASPRVRYWLWQIVTIKLLVMPFWVLAVPLPFPAWHGTPPERPDVSSPEAFPPALERELACDQVAMTVSGHAPGDYAQTLVHVASHASQPADIPPATDPDRACDPRSPSQATENHPC